MENAQTQSVLKDFCMVNCSYVFCIAKPMFHFAVVLSFFKNSLGFRIVAFSDKGLANRSLWVLDNSVVYAIFLYRFG